MNKKRPGKTPERKNKAKEIYTDAPALKKKAGSNGIWCSGKDMDFTFFTIVILLVCAGLVSLLSASSTLALRSQGTSYYFFANQLRWALLGIAAMWAVSHVEYKFIGKIIWIGAAVGMVMMFLTMTSQFGVTHNGARRWIRIFGVEFQPSELMKPIIAIVMAIWVQHKNIDTKTVKGYFYYFIPFAITAVPMFIQGHLSGTIVILGISVIILICYGTRFKYLLVSLVVGTPLAVFVLRHDATRWSRLMAAYHPFESATTYGYQNVQSLYAIASGGFFGKGVGQSIQKAFIPEVQNDFIFSVVCEEVGLFGAVLVMLLFIGLIIRGVVIASRAPDTFSMLVAFGITGHIALQFVLNIGVVTSLVPNTGMTLPFFSAGGTALLVLMAEMGIMLNISRHRVIV